MDGNLLVSSKFTQCHEGNVDGVRVVSPPAFPKDKDELVVLLEKVRDSSDSLETILDAFNRDQHEDDYVQPSDFEVLAKGDLDLAIETVASSQPAPRGFWFDDREEVAKLQHASLQELFDHWRQRGCLDQSDHLPNMLSSYQLSLFGIEAPGGLHTWDAVMGTTRQEWLPDLGLSAKIDVYGTLAPEPAANRLFVPFERSHELRGAVIMGFLRHARGLAFEHCKSQGWRDWFKGFMGSWNYQSGLTGSLTRAFSKELQEEPSLPNVPNSIWVATAANHSAFGGFVFLDDFDRQFYWISQRDVSQPVAREHIEAAAHHAGVANDEIDATVDSLSDYLGWDITKGRESAQD